MRTATFILVICLSTTAFVASHSLGIPLKQPHTKPVTIDIVENPVPDTVENKVPYAVHVDRPVPVTLEKQVPYPVDRPYPVTVEKQVVVPVPHEKVVTIEKHIPVAVQQHRYKRNHGSTYDNNYRPFVNEPVYQSYTQVDVPSRPSLVTVPSMKGVPPSNSNSGILYEVGSLIPDYSGIWGQTTKRPRA